MRYIIVTGMSGAGKSCAAGALEDMGFYCIDNMPVALIPEFVSIYSRTGALRGDVAFIVDVRGESDFTPLIAEISALRTDGCDCRLLALDCSDKVLLNRYKETRRIHPLSAWHNITVTEALSLERKLLEPVFAAADYRIDTTYLTPKQLRGQIEQVQNIIDPASRRRMTVNVMSFGFKNGSVPEADLMFDVRCFPNPFYIPELKPLTGLDAPVREYILNAPQTLEFIGKLYDMLDFLIPLYVGEGKKQLTVAIGCTGGKHRSVMIAELLAAHLKERGELVSVIHRDINNGIG